MVGLFAAKNEQGLTEAGTQHGRWYHTSKGASLYNHEPFYSLLGGFYDPIHLFAVSLRFTLKFKS